MNVNEIRNNYNIRNSGVDKASHNMYYYNVDINIINGGKRFFIFE